MFSSGDLIKYVVGLIFDASLENVILIKKNRPDWQIGKLNGIGGKVEPDETAEDAIVRECFEESDLMLSDWVLWGEQSDNKNFTVHYYTAEVDLHLMCIDSKTDELVSIYSIKDLNLVEEVLWPVNEIIKFITVLILQKW